MSAPAPAAPATLADLLTRRSLLRLLGMGACVVAGFVAIWQGFGAAGYGTDTHPHRALWACIQLSGFALVLVCVKGWFPVRLLVALVFFASACGAWWGVRPGGIAGRSLGAAVAERDRYRELLATAKAEDLEQNEGLKGIQSLTDEYPSLTAGLSVDYERWKAATADEIVARYARTPSEDVRTFVALRRAGRELFLVHPASKDRLDAAEREWLARAVAARIDELAGATGDWDAFERTAPGRKALANELPGWPDALEKAEEAWAIRTFEREAFGNADGAPDRRINFYKRLVALKSLNTFDNRFHDVRRMLFEVEHQFIEALVSHAHKKGRYAAAFGLARKHAVEWNAAAVGLGEPYVKQLDELRARCEALAKLHENDPEPAEPVEIAPAPRPRPEK